MEATVHILLRDGYERLNTKAVAELAGVSVGSLYQYFPNKQAILAEIIRRRTKQIIAAIVEAASTTATVEDMARATIAAFLREKHSKLPLSRALREPMAEIDGVEIIRESAASILDLLGALLEERLARPLSDAETARMALTVSAVEGAVASLILAREDALQRPETCETLTRIFLAGLALDEAPQPNRSAALA